MGSSDFPFVVIKIVREQLYQLNVSKSMEPHGIHLIVLAELADVIAAFYCLDSEWKPKC